MTIHGGIDVGSSPSLRLRFIRSGSAVGVVAGSLVLTLGAAPPAAAFLDPYPDGAFGESVDICELPTYGREDMQATLNPDGVSPTTNYWWCTWVGPGYWGGAPSRQQMTASRPLPVGTELLIQKSDLAHPTWDSNDVYTGWSSQVAKIEWDLDGAPGYEVEDNGPWSIWEYFTSRQGTFFTQSHTWDSPGAKEISVRVTHTNSSTEIKSATINVVEDAVTPALVLEPAGALVLTDEEVGFSAAGSTAISGVIQKYEWDLDGDGTFETDGTSTAQRSWNSPGTKTVGVRVTSRGGSTATVSQQVVVTPRPPAGEVGLTVNQAANYTQDKNVTLGIVWPEHATSMRISNDGGFGAGTTTVMDPSASVPWVLDDSVAGLYTKVVYLRFSGPGIDSTRTYSDDIIFDNTAPSVAQAGYQVAGAWVIVTVNAHDAESGLSNMEIANGAATVSVPHGSQVLIPAASLGVANGQSRARSGDAVSAQALALQLRVGDKAGNWSGWTTLTGDGTSTEPTPTPTPSPSTSAEPSPTPAPTYPSPSPAPTASATVKKGKTLTTKALLRQAGIAQPKKSTTKLAPTPGSKTVCKILPKSAGIKALKKGTCRIKVTVKPKRGKAATTLVTITVK